MLEHFVTNVGKLHNIMLRKKMMATLPKNVDEKLGYAPKNVDEKVLPAVPKNVDEKMFATFSEEC
jgi:hypothetical protein